MPDTGDILIEIPTGPTSTGHTIMYVADGKIVHAVPPNEFDDGVVQDDYDMVSGPIAVFTCRKKAVAQEAARLAIAWSRPAIKTTFSSSATRTSAQGFNEGRVLGITEATQKPELRTFAYDALYRAAKWAANRGERHFSRNRGTTCCPFVTACFQAAWLRYHYGNRDAEVERLFKALAERRPAKAPKQERIDVLHVTTGSGSKLGRRPFPQYSRVAGDIGPELWESIVGDAKRLGGETLRGPEDLVTPGLLVDAKFNSTRNLLAMLTADQANWARVDLEV